MKVSLWGPRIDGQRNRTPLLIAVCGLGFVFGLATTQAATSIVSWGDYAGPVPPGLTNVAAIAAGGIDLIQTRPRHALALNSDGTVVAWGDNSAGQTIVPAGLSNVLAIAAGGEHSLALTSAGQIIAWGAGLTNVRINPHWGQSSVPASFTNIAAMAAGGFHTLVLKADGTVAAWGNNSQGQTNVPFALTSTTANVVAVAAGRYHSLALQGDGTVVAWGRMYIYQEYLRQYGWTAATPPVGLSNVVAIAAGGNHALALRADGTLAGWGDNSYGEIVAPDGFTNVVGIAAGDMHSLALRADGTVLVWGSDFAGQMNLPSGLTNVSAISAAERYSIVLSGVTRPFVTAPPIITPLNNGSAVAGTTLQARAVATGVAPLGYQWKFNGVDIPAMTNAVLTLTNVQPDQTGLYAFTLSNAFGMATSPSVQLTVVPMVVSIWSYSRQSFVGGSATFGVYISGQGPFQYQWQFNGTDLAGQTNDLLYLGNLRLNQAGDYSVKVSNQFGRVTSGTRNLSVVTIAVWGMDADSIKPVPPGLEDVVDLAAGYRHAIALKAGGTVVGWGGNPYCSTNVPAGLSNVVAIAAGRDHCLSLSGDGTVTAWGSNSSGQTNLPGDVTGCIMIAAGGAHNLALKANGAVTAWGYNADGQATVPPSLTEVVAIAVGDSHSLALKADGTVVAWGKNRHKVSISGGGFYYVETGQTNVPAGLSNVVAIAGGTHHSLALRGDGMVAAWGKYQSWPDWVPMAVPANVTNVVAIAAANDYCLAALSDGTVAAWRGYSSSGPSGLTNSVRVAGGFDVFMALVGQGAPTLGVSLSDIRLSAGTFSLSFPSRRGHVARLEFTDSLSDSTWMAFPLFAGEGGVRTLADLSATNSRRFYRVRQW